VVTNVVEFLVVILGISIAVVLFTIAAVLFCALCLHHWRLWRRNMQQAGGFFPWFRSMLNEDEWEEPVI